MTAGKEAIKQKLHDMVDALFNAPQWIWETETSFRAFPMYRMTLRPKDYPESKGIVLVVGLEEDDDDDQ